MDHRVNEYFNDQAQWADPFPFYHELHTAPPFESSIGGWLVSRWADVNELLRGERTTRVTAADADKSPIHDLMPQTLLDLDPPEHTRVRSAIRGVFTPKATRNLRESIHAHATKLLDGLAEAGGFDVLNDFAYPLTVRVISEMVGVPLHLSDLLLEAAGVATRSRHIGKRVGEDAHVKDGSYVRARELRAQVGELLADRRQNPQDDVLTSLSDLPARGLKDDDEAITMAILLLLAGHDTTSTMISLSVLNLLRHPAELARLRDDLSLVPNAVEELLRFDAPTQIPAHRIWAAEDISLGEVTIPAGARVIPVLGAANRDPIVFTDPDRLDITRPNANRQVSFLFGTHHCAGAPLARTEVQVALHALLTRLPSFDLVTEDIPWRPNAVVRGLDSLKIGW